MTTEDLEFSISQYVDGTLSGSERSLLDIRLSEDPKAQALLAEYRRLDVLLKSAPMPPVRWEAFARSISQAVDAATEESEASAYRMPTWIRATALRVSLAASVLIATGLGVRMYVGSHPSTSSSSNVEVAKVEHSTPPAVASNHPENEPSAVIVVGSSEQPTSGPAEIQVAVGPSDLVKDEPVVVQYSDAVNSRPSHVAIASGVVPAHDTLPLSLDMQ